MNLLSEKKLNHLISKLNRPVQLFNPALRMDEMRVVLGPVALLANQLATFTPQLLDCSDITTVLVYGMTGTEIYDNASNFALINRILGTTNKPWHFIFISGEPDNQKPVKVKSQFKDPAVQVTIDVQSLDEALDCYSEIDVISLNVPKFEANAMQLLHGRLSAAVKDGISVVGCSTGSEEALMDQHILSLFGFQSSDAISNRFNINVPQQRDHAYPGTDVDQCYLTMNQVKLWGNHLWQIIGYSDPEKESIEFYKDTKKSIDGIALYLMTTRQIGGYHDVLPNLLRSKDDSTTLRICGNYTLLLDPNPHYQILFDELTSQAMAHGIVTPRITKKLALGETPSVLDLYLDIGLVFKEHIKPHAKDMGEDDVVNLLHNINKNADGHEICTAKADTIPLPKRTERPIDPDHVLTLELIKKHKYSEIASMGVNELHDVLNEKGQSIPLIACASNDTTLLQIALYKGLDLNRIDDDGFTIMDICAEHNATDAAVMLLKSHQVDNLLNRQGYFGVTPAHRALTHMNFAVYEVFKSHNADLELVNYSGVSAGQMESMMLQEMNCSLAS
jgi:hypothetical protein